MKNLNNPLQASVKTLAFLPLLAFSCNVLSATLPAIVDDFSHAQQTQSGLQRQFMNDSVAGGNTHTNNKISSGIMYLKGDITPPRGQPGWASSILPLAEMGMPQDASQYTGLRLLVKINSGTMSVSANSTEVTNYDYHASPVSVVADGQFHEVKIPFTSMKRGWSEQTPLNAATLNSISITAFAMQKASFDFEIDEIGFY
ncbi:CIA30 family protein [Neptunicella marina]|uniref:CIA30 family protein n=1 Tax=Neptunicella marina TaxID=2125989 RepID=A0A8J6IPJ5_9ALTE|nr:CIA30 family protein [Neptunicella marina]MBC3765520.1 CIA30 family protein [Neptunicella marina]